MLVKEKLNRYQKGITLHTKSREVRCLCGFPALCLLFKLAPVRRFLNRFAYEISFRVLAFFSLFR